MQRVEQHLERAQTKAGEKEIDSEAPFTDSSRIKDESWRTHPNAIKIAEMRRVAFADVEALEKSGTVIIPDK